MKLPIARLDWTRSAPLPPAEPELPSKVLLLADLLHILLAGVVLSSILFLETNVSFGLRLLLTGLIIFVLLRNGVWLILGALQFRIWISEPGTDQATLTPENLLYALVCLGLVAYAAGFQTLRRELSQWLALIFQVILEVAPDESPAVKQIEVSSDQAAARIARDYWLRELSSRIILRVLRLMALLLIAAIAFAQLPFTRTGVRQWWDRSVDSGYVYWPGPTVFLAGVTCLILLSIFSWRAMTRGQAGLYLRSMFVCYHYRELRSILVRHNRLNSLSLQTERDESSPDERRGKTNAVGT